MNGVQDRNWPGRRVNIKEVKGLKYQVIETISKPSLVLSQDYCNSLSINGEFKFKKSTETGSSASWTVTDSISFGSSITAYVGIPSLGGVKFTESINMTFEKT